ncbi:MAG: hypothetical protein ABMA64_30680 [Myxococcota bacterium]
MSAQLGLCLADADAIDSVARVMNAASSGIELAAGQELRVVLDRASPDGLQLLVVDANHGLTQAMELLPKFPNARLLVITDEVGDALLASALRTPKLIGFVGRTDGMLRAWELSYLVRRVVTPQQPMPGSHELLNWGASSVTFRPRTTRDRDQAVAAVEVVSARFGMSRRAAALAADAGHELLMNAMYDAPVDAAGNAKYAQDRTASITLLDHEIPTLRLTVDGAHLALDMVDPFGRLPRAKLFGGLLRGRTGAVATHASAVLDVSHGGAGLGMFKLYSTAAILRVEVQPGRQTLVSWVLDRSTGQRGRTMAHSLYFLEGR